MLVDTVENAVEVLAGRPLAALTGAGLSTDSGIPDYRGPGSPRRLPMTYGEFLSGPTAQRRYWARSHVGWTRIGKAAPNDGHRALAALERSGPLRGLITQNVDGLHTAAGSRAVIDLHGRIADVICTACGRRSSRAALQQRFAAANPGFVETAGDAVETAPDGDAELAATDGFRLVGCDGCGGLLKPDVVFFGENVPRERVARAYAMVDDAWRRRPARRRLLAHRDVRPAVRPPRPQARHPRGDRQPGRHARRRAGRRPDRRGLQRDPHGARGGPVRLRVALTRSVVRSITTSTSRSIPAAASQHSGRPTTMASATWNGNASCVSHSSTASHQSTIARTTSHRVVRADCG